MALSSRKISGLLEYKEALTGDEFLMVAFNNRSYKIKTSVFTSDIINNISQQVVKGDDKYSTITISTSGGDKYTFLVKNGSKGSEGKQGPQGKKGQTGNAGLAIYNTELEDIIIDNVAGVDNSGNEMSDDELTAYALSARQGYLLNNKLDSLAEEYITQDEYDERLSMNKINAAVKYFIVEDES